MLISYLKLDHTFHWNKYGTRLVALSQIRYSTKLDTFVSFVADGRRVRGMCSVDL